MENKIAVKVAIARLTENKQMVKANHKAATDLNSGADIAALDEKISQLEAITKREKREKVKIYRYNVPSQSTVGYDEAIDKLSMLTNTEVEEGYISRDLLAPVPPFSAEDARWSEIKIFVD